MTNRKFSIVVRDDVDAPSASFKIDHALRGLWAGRKLTSHWKSEQQVIAFGRFALDKTTHMALGASEKLLTKNIHEDWKEIAGRAETASAALRDLISWIAGPAYFDRSPEEASPDVPSWKAHTLRPAFGKMAATRGERIETGVRYAQTIAAADEILSAFASFALEQRKRVGATSDNPGDPVLAEFILRLAETWFLLTGKVPSVNARPESNKFLQFAILAWEDAGGEAPTGTTFGQAALAVAVAHLKLATRERPNYIPDWAQ